MTAWQDQPPVSRRQVRQTERDGSVESQPTPDENSSEENGFSGLARQGWEADARRASAPQGPPETRAEAAIASGRRAQQPASGHRTEPKPLAPEQQTSEQQTLGQPASEQLTPEPLAFRRRDYSPAGSPARLTPPASAWVPPVSDIADDPTPAEQPAPPAQAVLADGERPLTRREMRARGLGGFAAAPAEPAQVEPAAVEPAQVKPAQLEPAQLEPAQPADIPRFRNRVRESAPETGDVTIAEIVYEPVADTASESPEQSPRAEAHQAEAQQEGASAFEELLFPDAPSTESTGATITPEPRAEENPSYTPPVGHWSTQALIDDGQQAQDTLSGRDVGATGGSATNALVLPSIPTADSIMGPLSGTGEILITGSINLPSSMGTTGVHPARYDHSDVDALLAADDREDSDPESAPVRAIRAVSTNTGSGDVINSMKPRKASRLPMILTITGAVVGVAVIALLVAGIVFGIFK